MLRAFTHSPSPPLLFDFFVVLVASLVFLLCLPSK
jgi:hypothetical protein